jgi:triphosphoribosyl-dephospho-CoA synthase
MALSREEISAAYEGACRLEIEALKPGNVHLFADGHGMTAGQFLLSASVSAGPLTDPDLPVGRRILEAIRATRQAVGTNTNLGIVLLAAPLARAAEAAGGDLRENLSAVLEGLDMSDAGAVFEAIVVALPGGLGSADEHDVREPPKVGVLEAMRAAAQRDRIARQYVTRFEDMLEASVASGRPYSPIWRFLPASRTAMWRASMATKQRTGSKRKPPLSRSRSTPPTTIRRACACFWTSTAG